MCYRPAAMVPAYLRMMGRRYWAHAAGASVLTALLIGLPTDVLPNPWFTRMTPVGPLDYVFWPLTSLLTGMLLATYVLPAAPAGSGGRRAGVGAGVLGWLAIGCPVCNKLVVVLLGSAGAMEYFAPVQPVLGALAVGLAGAALAIRLRGFVAGCQLTPG
jgi:hypothetical protein